jgi:hypothetical protein
MPATQTPNLIRRLHLPSALPRTLPVSDIKKLWEIHQESREMFEAACRSDDISQKEYEAIRARYARTMKAYHDALGYGDHVGQPREQT